MAGASYTLTEIARRLDVPQHRLIHLCEKGVVAPEVHDAAGRGSSRVFSENNVLEFAVALRLRDMLMPVSIAGAIVHVLRRFGEELRTGTADVSLAQSLRGPASPELRVIVSDGKSLFFSLANPGKKASLFGGIPLEGLTGRDSGWQGEVRQLGTTVRHGEYVFGGPEGSEFARMELSVNAVARSLQLD